MLTHFSQELYEPLWDELYKETKKQGLRIRSIWMADVAWQGQSGILNADKLGNDRTYLDSLSSYYFAATHRLTLF
jgi:hypothetical protein